jgi:hypothetical protein
MKKTCLVVMVFFYFSLSNSAKGQAGYVLLNEYMPWTTNTCTVNGEFIELYNFGPGPVNIGCYIVTDGDFSITIPANTILNAGQFYVLGGADNIPIGCANINAATTVNLNWNTCNCTSGTIPTTGDGLMTDGGSANEQIVLFDPNLKVIDAVARSTPVETASAIATSTVSGGCTSKSYDLDTMTISYETIGESAGRGNSFARKLNGDCDWDKDPQQSAGATNNKGGTASSLSSVLTITNPTTCPGTGSIAVSFTGVSDYSTIFPVQYILAKDIDSNNVFNLADTYTNGVDSTSPTVDVSGLSAGHYEIALQPKTGCNYQFYEFTILPCGTVILEANTFYFNAKRHDKSVELIWTSNQVKDVKKFEIEKSLDGINFQNLKSYTLSPSTGSFKNFKYNDVNPLSVTSYYRIKIYYVNGTIGYSLTEKVPGIPEDYNSVTFFPNPVLENLNISFQSKTSQNIIISVLQADGKSLREKQVNINTGFNKISFETTGIQNGLYFVKIYQQSGSVIIKKIYKQ